MCGDLGMRPAGFIDFSNFIYNFVKIYNFVSAMAVGIETYTGEGLGARDSASAKPREPSPIATAAMRWTRTPGLRPQHTEGPAAGAYAAAPAYPLPAAPAPPSCSCPPNMKVLTFLEILRKCPWFFFRRKRILLCLFCTCGPGA